MFYKAKILSYVGPLTPLRSARPIKCLETVVNVKLSLTLVESIFCFTGTVGSWKCALIRRGRVPCEMGGREEIIAYERTSQLSNIKALK